MSLDPNNPDAPKKRGRPRKLYGERGRATPTKFLAKRTPLDLSNLFLKGDDEDMGLGIEDLLEETKMRGLGIPTFVQAESGRGLFRLDSLIQCSDPTPLRGRNVFATKLEAHEREALTPSERLRVSLYEGTPMYRNFAHEVGQAVIVDYEPEHQLYAHTFQFKTAVGSMHHGLILWQAPAPNLSQARLNMPGWRRLNVSTKTRITLMKQGQVNHVLAKLDKNSVIPEVPRWYPVLQTRPLNPRTTTRSRVHETRNEENFMLDLLDLLKPLPNLLLDDRSYNLNVEHVMHEEDARLTREREEFAEKRARALSLIQAEAEAAASAAYADFFSAGASEHRAELHRIQTYESYISKHEIRIPEPLGVRKSLIQESLRAENFPLVNVQGAVVLMVSDPIPELLGQPPTEPGVVLGGREHMWKKMNRRVKEDGEKGVGRSVPNLARMTTSGGRLTAKSDSIFIQHEIRPRERAESLRFWPSFIPPRESLSTHFDSLRISEIDPPAAVAMIDPYRVFGQLSDEEQLRYERGEMSVEETEYLVFSRAIEKRRIAILLNPGQAVAHTKLFWAETTMASRIFELEGGYHLLIFGHGGEISWSISEPQSMQTVLSVLTGRDIVTFDSSRYRGPIVPYDETLQLENTEEPEYLLDKP